VIAADDAVIGTWRQTERRLSSTGNVPRERSAHIPDRYAIIGDVDHLLVDAERERRIGRTPETALLGDLPDTRTWRRLGP
jgi:hypothetical protein